MKGLLKNNKSLMNEYNYEKNKDINLDKISLGSAKKAWWICKYGHEWQDEIRGRFKGNGCPYCSGHRVMVGFNDLRTTHPQLIKEWDYEKNGSEDPNNYSKGSAKKVWWKCEYGHSWESAIYHRTKDRGCPICNKIRQTSFAEQAIYFYLSLTFPDIINRYKDIFNNGMEIDIYIPSQKIGIEYDGMYFHKGKKSEIRELTKYNICRKNGIRLIRIKENIDDVMNGSSDYTIYCNWSSGKYEDLDNALTNLFNYLGLNTNVNTKNDKYDIMSLYKSKLKKDSLTKCNPNLAKEWNYEKNRGLTPEMFTCNSGVSVWWTCPNGHEYKSSINKRNQNQSCPYCSNHKIVEGFNDLASNCPELLEEWDYEKNTNIDPKKVSIGSSKKVWWKCSNGHEWQVVINKRTSGHKCPYCSNKIVRKGYNDLFTTNPELTKEWDYKKNKTISPYEISAGSAKKAWWVCSKCGESWLSEIRNKVSGKSKCPNCKKSNVF